MGMCVVYMGSSEGFFYLYIDPTKSVRDILTWVANENLITHYRIHHQLCSSRVDSSEGTRNRVRVPTHPDILRTGITTPTTGNRSHAAFTHTFRLAFTVYPYSNGLMLYNPPSHHGGSLCPVKPVNSISSITGMHPTSTSIYEIDEHGIVTPANDPLTIPYLTMFRSATSGRC
ncbi:hypothetical protein DFH27DRAFT_153181 [Peziza echinospora]|nr:hypothetical protein DFH27DRAFT_153181 [Peziza echinospora]